MLIKCPECQFSREINEQKIPDKSVVATCPKCKTKFKFRELPEEEETFSLETETAPTEEAPEPASSAQEDFPSLHDPAEDPGDELWRKIGDMSPPKGEKKNDERHQPRDEEQQIHDPLDAPLAEEAERPVVEVPFEKLDEYGFFPGIFATIKRILFTPSLFFSVMPLGRGMVRPLVFALLILVLHDVLQVGYMNAGLLPVLDLGPFGTAEPGTESMSLFMLTLVSPFLRTVIMFALAGLYHLFLVALRGAGGGFEGTFRAVAYSYAPYILGYIPIPNDIGFMTQQLLFFFWGMIISIIGLKCIHRTQYIKPAAAVLIPFLVVLYAVAQSFLAMMPTV